MRHPPPVGDHPRPCPPVDATRRAKKPYAADVLAIRANPHRTARELAAALGRSAQAVQRRRLDLGIGPGRGRTTAVPKPPKVYVNRPWTAAEDATVRANPTVPAADLAKRLGRSAMAVHQRRSRLRRAGKAPRGRAPT